MALSFAHGSIQWLAADVATTIYTISGLPFRPVALRFYWQGLASAVDTTVFIGPDVRRGMGLATGTAARRCVATLNVAAASTTTCVNAQFTDCVVATLTATGPARDGALDLNSITADGFTLIVDDQIPADLTIFYEVWGGIDTLAVIGDITEPAATGDQDYSVPGFDDDGNEDQVVFFAGCQQTAADTVARGDTGFSTGWATSGDTDQNFVSSASSVDNVADTSTAVYLTSGECLAMFLIGLAANTINARAQLTQFNTDGFRLNWIARAVTNRRYIFLAIKGGRWRAGTVTLSSGSIGDIGTVTGLPFVPRGLSFLTIMSSQNNPAGSGFNDDRWSIGTASTSASRRTMGMYSQDGLASTGTDYALQYDEAVSMLISTQDHNIGLQSTERGGFTLVWDGPYLQGIPRYVGFVASGGPKFFLLT